MNDSTCTRNRLLAGQEQQVAWLEHLPAGVRAGSMSANAASTSPSGNSSTSTEQPQANFPAHGSTAHESAEKSVTGANATKAQAAAVKFGHVGGDCPGLAAADGLGYELTVTKSDEFKVEVHLDNSFNVHDHDGFDG